MKEIKPGYKETPIGVLPKDWEVKSLEEIATIVMGQSPSSEYYNSENIGTPLIQGNADFNKRKIKNRIFTEQITKVCEKGDIIMTVRAPVGAIALSEISACIGRGVCAIKFNSLFLYHYLVFSENRWEKISQGSTFTAVNSGDIKSFLVPIPPKEEQEKIAQILMTWDEAIEKQEELIEQEKEFKKGMMQKIFSQKLRFKAENGNDYPEWEEKKLGEVGEVISGLTYSPNDIVEKGILVLRSSNVQDRTLKFEDNVYVDVDVYNPVKENDILICVRNGSKQLIGKNALITKENEGLAFGAFMSVFRSPINKFIFQYFDTSKYKEKVYKNLGATINSINGSDLKKFEIDIPSLPEQEKIANFLSTIDEKIEVLEKKLEELKEQKKGLMQKLLTGEVRV